MIKTRRLCAEKRSVSLLERFCKSLYYNTMLVSLSSEILFGLVGEYFSDEISYIGGGGNVEKYPCLFVIIVSGKQYRCNPCVWCSVQCCTHLHGYTEGDVELQSCTITRVVT